MRNTPPELDDTLDAYHSAEANPSEAATPAPAGLLENSRQLAGSLGAMLQTRLALAGIELAEEKQRLQRLALFAVLALLFTGIGLVAFTGLVVVLCWDNYRWQSLLALLAVYGGVAGYCWQRVSQLAKREQPLFAATLAELEKDREALKP